jgi:beta-fructofuranosidase
MIFRPEDNTRLWDPWIYKEGELFHMFYIGAPLNIKKFDHIGHAVSTDLVHWKRKEAISLPGPKGAWDEKDFSTGRIVKHNGKYYIFYGAGNLPQQYGVLISEDMENWRKYANNPIVGPSQKYYQTTLSDSLPLWYVSWRDPWIEWEPDLRKYEALFFARTKTLTPGLGTSVARALSTDLIHWEPALHLTVIEDHVMAELPQHVQIGDVHYLLYCSVDGRGTAYNTPDREFVSGTFYRYAKERDGEYVNPSDPLLFGSGNGRHEGYAGQIMQFGNEYIFYHQIRTQPAETARFVFGIKKVHQEQDGTLRLQYWPGHSMLQIGQGESLIPGSVKDVEEGLEDVCLHNGKDIGVGRWDADGGYLQGSSVLVASAVYKKQLWSDFNLYGRVEVHSTPHGRRKVGCAGIVFRYNPENRVGVVVVLDYDRNTVEICGSRTGWRWIGRTVWDRCSFKMGDRLSHTLRVLCRAEFAEVYVDDWWVFSTALQESPNQEALENVPRRGMIGFYVEDSAAVFSEVRIVPLQPLL